MTPQGKSMWDYNAAYKKYMDASAQYLEKLRSEIETSEREISSYSLRRFQAGVRSVYLQAKHESRDDIAEWILERYPSVELKE